MLSQRQPCESGATRLAASHGFEEYREGWHVVNTKDARPRTVARVEPQLLTERQHTLYLKKMKGLCFNCLSRDPQGCRVL
jgi:hypothetical protein